MPKQKVTVWFTAKQLKKCKRVMKKTGQSRSELLGELVDRDF